MSKQCDNVNHGSVQIKMEHFQFQFARLDLGEIKNVIDKPQEIFTTPAYQLGIGVVSPKPRNL